MSNNDPKGSRLKSAYELALERLGAEGIEPPREDALPEPVKHQIAEIRGLCRSKIAELEILHRDRLRKLQEPEARRREEEEFARERRRLEEEAERRITRLRSPSPSEPAS